MYIDSHVHCRDGNQRHKETIKHALEVAEKTGVDAIFDMPNTDPPITTRLQVEERLSIADSCNSNVFYGLYLGLTSNPDQVRKAVKVHNDLFPRVVGLKLFAGRSVGDLAVVDEEAQDKVYYALNNYKGVLVVHCEKESLLNPDLWNPEDPKTHSFARPCKAELESIIDQVKFAWGNEFKGNLHIAHISSPESVEYVDSIRRNLGDNPISRLDISCGATPHHLFLNYEMIESYEENGLFWKVNPPLRSEKEQKGLLKCLKEGKINWIETDHAPHTLKEKLNPPYMSGIPGLDKWPKIYKRLEKEGFQEEEISDLVFNNAMKIFKIPKNTITKTNNIGDLSLKEYEYI